MSLKTLASRLKKLDCETKVEGNQIILKMDDFEIELDAEQDNWNKAVTGFYRAKQYSYDEERRILKANRFVEIALTRVDPFPYFSNPEYTFTDSKNNKVQIGTASKEFLLSYFESTRYERTFNIIQKRMKRRFERFRASGRPVPKRNRTVSLENLFPTFFTTARYVPKKISSDDDVKSDGIEIVRACLFSLAYKKDECWEISDDVKSRGMPISLRSGEKDEDLKIPKAHYDPGTVKHYKVAKSSFFPSQVFLSYYHILEYYFLRVADEKLVVSVRAKLNDPKFNSSYQNISGLVETVKRNDYTSDETDMLRAVLKKYVPENEYIEFLQSEEEEQAGKPYSNTKQIVFGRRIYIRLEEGHALSNTAELLKHIRNTLVHSSDRHTREDGFIPFTESEEVVVKYIPLIQYLAEKVIFSTAE